jgi:hypothetical protein
MKIFSFLITLSLTFICLSSCSTASREDSVSVLSIEKEIDTTSSDTDICRSFSLSNEDVATYFSTAQEVDKYRFHHEAIIMPCKYSGSIEIGSKQYKWEIYAGGAGYLFTNDTVVKWFLCTGKCCDILPKLC